MKGDASYKIWVEVEEVREGAPGEDPTHKTLLDVNSTDHGNLVGALEAGIASLIAAKHQRLKEMEEAMKLMPIFFTAPNTIDCGTAQEHSAGLDRAPEPSSTYHPYEVGCCAVSVADHAPEGRLITNVDLPKFDAVELAGIAGDPEDTGLHIDPEMLALVAANAQSVQDAEPLPKRERAETPRIPSMHYNCGQECAAAGHTNGPHTVVARGLDRTPHPGEKVLVIEP